VVPPPPKPIETPEPPKIKLPDVKIPDPPKPIPVVAPKVLAVVTPAAPKVQVQAAAPKVQSINMPAQSAAVKNNSTSPPAPVSAGMLNSPVPSNLAGPAVSTVNMKNGMSGMPPGSGVGKPSAVNIAGNGGPTGSLGGGSVVAVQGVKVGGCIGCDGKKGGNGTGTQIAQVQLPTAQAIPQPTTAVVKAPMRTAPQVLSKPTPTYTAEATTLHIQGVVIVKIKVAASGAVTVVGVQSGLGHGLDESAVRCAQGIKFKPAADASGNPIDWEGVVNITFQMA
jgi:TonB family protein